MIEEILTVQKTAQEVSKFVSPCFKSGEYKKILESARQYQDMESSHRKMTETVIESTEAHGEFLRVAMDGSMIHEGLNMKNAKTNDDLKTLYDSI